MLFLIDKKNNTILHPDAIKLCPRLSIIEKQELLFIILAYDYRSPYHQFPEEERIRKSIRQIFGNDNSEVINNKKVQEAIEEYRSLQYDHRRETIIQYQKKISELNDQLSEENDVRKIKSIDDAIERLSDRCEKIQLQVDTSDEAELRGGGEKSFLEKWQENRKVFIETKNHKKERKGIELIG